MSIERGSLLLQTGRVAEAEQQFRAALVDEPGNALGHAMIGLCLLQSKKLKEADAEARQAIGLRPDWYLGYSILAQILSERERIKPALGAVGQALELNPFDPDLHALLAQLRLKQRDWPGALAAADAGLSVNPEHRDCLNLRSMALRNLGRRDEAGQTLEHALERNPHDAATHANQGWTLLHSGDHKAALKHFREALRINAGLDMARAGIVEALKARNILYRMMLKYFLFMSRMSRGVQWGIIIGAYLGQWVLENAAFKYPVIAPYVRPIILAYIVFALLTWLASPMFNLMLRVDRFGRYALSRDQTVSSNWVGGLLLSGLIIFVVGWWWGISGIEMAGIFTAIMTMPVVAVFQTPPGWPRWTMVGYSVVLAFVGALVITQQFIQILPYTTSVGRMLGNSITVFGIGVLASGIVANGLASAVVRR